MRVCVALVAVLACGPLAWAQDAEQETARKAGQKENRQGVGLYNAGRYREALACFERALPLAEKGFGKESPQAATTLGNLSLQHQMVGRHDQALPLLERALAIREKAL